MSGINSISGLNKVNVDFRPTIEPDVPNTANANQPQPVEVINLDDEPQPPARNEAKNVVKDLDVLLLNAAGRSVTMDTAKNVNAIGKDLVNTGIISEKDLAKLESLAKDAAAKLKALDKFSGREIAKALMVDKKSEYGDLVWGKGFFGLNSTAKAVKAAVEAQEKLSEALAKFNDRLAGSKDVTPCDAGRVHGIAVPVRPARDGDLLDSSPNARPRPEGRRERDHRRPSGRGVSRRDVQGADAARGHPDARHGRGH